MRTKHIEIDYHFVRVKVALGDLITKFVSFSDQVEDIFTKSLIKNIFIHMRVKLGVVEAPHPSLRGSDRGVGSIDPPSNQAISPSSSPAACPKQLDQVIQAVFYMTKYFS